MLGVAFGAGVSTHLCECVAAVVTGDRDPPVQRLSRGSGARASVRQRAAVDVAVPNNVPIHGEVVPDARGRLGCAQVPALVLLLEISPYAYCQGINLRAAWHNICSRPV